jgi:hypothetical protein
MKLEKLCDSNFRKICRRDPLRWPRDTVYPQKLTNFADKRRSLGRYSFFCFLFIDTLFEYILKFVGKWLKG